MTSQITEQHAGRGYRYKHGDRPLDGYTIQRAAGRGGFGEVYFAISDSGREVALKVVQAFEQIELRGIGQCMNLKSPHLVSIFDVRQGDDGQPIVIMEYVAGPSLRELLDQSPTGLGTQKSAFFLREIAKGLIQLHDCGIVHRDLKPANIFYEGGYVKIGDYGLSKAISASHRSGQTVTVGTVHYMAPEVGAGCYDRSIDIYALGALLYELLKGQPPFHGGSTAEVLMKHLATEVDVSGISEPFASVIARAMQKDPARRYSTVQEMVEAVYGVEQIRDSVSCFSPDALTLVAGRAANRAGIGTDGANLGGRPLSSRPFATDAVNRPANACADWAVRAGARIERLSNAAAEIGGGLASFVRKRTGARASAATPWAQVDPLPRKHRSVLVLLAILMVTVLAAMFAPNYSRSGQPEIIPFLVLLTTAGGTLGVTLTARRFLPALHSESKLVRRFAFGAIGSTFAAIISLPAWAALASEDNSVAPLGIICAALFLIDWDKRTRFDRAERLSLRGLIVCIAIGIGLGFMVKTPSEEPIPIVIAVLCGISIAVQLASPWSPALAQPRDRSRRAPKPTIATPPPLPAAPPTAEPQTVTEQDMTAHAISLPPSPASGDAAAAATKSNSDDGTSFLGSLVRLPFVVVAAGLILLAMALSLAGALDLPGLIESGQLDPQAPRQLREDFGTAHWPEMMRFALNAGLFACAALGSSIWMLARRRSGGIHMARVAIGTLMLIAFPFILLGRNVHWTPALGHIDPDWTSILEDLFRQTRGNPFIPGMLVFAAALLIILWPANRRNSKSAAA